MPHDLCSARGRGLPASRDCSTSRVFHRQFEIATPQGEVENARLALSEDQDTTPCRQGCRTGTASSFETACECERVRRPTNASHGKSAGALAGCQTSTATKQHTIGFVKWARSDRRNHHHRG